MDRALWPPEVGTLSTDASTYRWGDDLGNLLPAAGFFSAATRSAHINLKEEAAVRLCPTALGPELLRPGGLLRIHTDNRVAIHVINAFTSRSPALRAELRRLRVAAAAHGVTLAATWLPSVANI